MPKPSHPFANLAGKWARDGDRLHDLSAFGSNPGNLRARIYVPEGEAASRPLVVVLHGCTQTAGGYDTGAGWSLLADEQGFMLLFPEQQRANNPNLCFNWFLPDDIRRDAGEALSIRQMIATLIRDHGADAERVFITGLSAGGAMVSVMLATYPEIFAGGAIIAGLPYGTANGVPQALDRMNGRGIPATAELDSLVRRASAHTGSWPTISVWHGSADATVNAANADAIISQWRSIHGVGESPSSVDTVDGYPHRIWRNAERRTVIEQYDVTGMGHGTPLKTKGGDRCGVAGPFMLEAGISSTRRIAAFWDLADIRSTSKREPAPRGEEPATVNQSTTECLPVLRSVRPERIHQAPRGESTKTKDVGRIIEDALRAAGLMR